MINVTAMDVRKLTQEPSAKVRSMLAAKIAMDYRSGNFTEAEAQIADDIFRILVKDVERKVRKTLSEQLCHIPHVPRDIVIKLASDETDIALPILEYSHVLTEDDLIEIVKSTKEVLKLCAVARRDVVPARVSDSLLETRQEAVLSSLFKNQGADLTQESLLRSWHDISDKRSLLETLVHRGNLPLTIAEKLYAGVSDELKQKLTRDYKINVPTAHRVAGEAREWEMLGIIPDGGAISPANDEQVEDLVDQLQMGGRLTHSLLIRALCMGSLSLFEAGIARLAGVPRVNARILLMDSGALGYHAIYETAGMPEGFAEAVRVLLQIALEETDFGQHKRIDFKKRVIDRIYMAGYHRSVENMEYLLSIIGGKLAAANVH